MQNFPYIPYSGKFSRGRNFCDFRDQTSSRQITKCSLPAVSKPRLESQRGGEIVTYTVGGRTRQADVHGRRTYTVGGRTRQADVHGWRTSWQADVRRRRDVRRSRDVTLDYKNTWVTLLSCLSCISVTRNATKLVLESSLRKCFFSQLHQLVSFFRRLHPRHFYHKPCNQGTRADITEICKIKETTNLTKNANLQTF